MNAVSKNVIQNSFPGLKSVGFLTNRVQQNNWFKKKRKRPKTEHIIVKFPKIGATKKKFPALGIRMTNRPISNWKLEDNEAMPSKFQGKIISDLKFHSQTNYKQIKKLNKVQR